MDIVFKVLAVVLLVITVGYIGSIGYSAYQEKDTEVTTEKAKKEEKKTEKKKSALSQREQAYAGKNPKLSEQQVIVEVSMNLDKEPYKDIETIKHPESITALVNKYYALPADYVPQDLVSVPSSGEHGDVQMRKEAAEAFEQLIEACRQKGLILNACSTYRSYDDQKILFENGKNSRGVDYADSYWTRAGSSEHQTGLAVDIRLDNDTSDLDAVRKNPNYSWFLEQLHEYGFILRYPDDKQKYTLIAPESWHLRYVGKETATEIYKDQLCLEEYYALKGGFKNEE
jgi:D-alanyl-D-alanine carboxypeptidase